MYLNVRRVMLYLELALSMLGTLTHSLLGKYETLTSPCANVKYQV